MTPLDALTVATSPGLMIALICIALVGLGLIHQPRDFDEVDR